MEKKRASSLRTGKLLQFFVVIGVIIGIFAASIGWLAGNIRQGLDLQGGTHIIMQAEDTEQNKVTTESIVQVINIMQKRVNEMGLTEPIIQREGANRIIIELPGERDPQKAIETIGKTAVLEFRDEEGNVCLTGEDLKDAREQIGQNREPLVALQFSKEGGDKFAKLTAANIGRIWMGIYLRILLSMMQLQVDPQLLPDKGHWKRLKIWRFFFAAVHFLLKYRCLKFVRSVRL